MQSLQTSIRFLLAQIPKYITWNRFLAIKTHSFYFYCQYHFFEGLRRLDNLFVPEPLCYICTSRFFCFIWVYLTVCHFKFICNGNTILLIVRLYEFIDTFIDGPRNVHISVYVYSWTSLFVRKRRGSVCYLFIFWFLILKCMEAFICV